MHNYTDLLTTMNEVNGYYQLSIHPTRINYYYTPFVRKSKQSYDGMFDQETCDSHEREYSHSSTVASLQPEQFKNNSNNGKMSDITKKKIARAIDYLVYLAQPKRLPHTKHGKGLFFRLNFVTLTLSSEQIHSDNEIQNHVLDRKSVV